MPTIVRGGVHVAPSDDQLICRLSGLSPPNASLARVSLMMAARGALIESSGPNVRPCRMGILNAWKYDGVTMVGSNCTGGSGVVYRPRSVRRYSALIVTWLNGARLAAATAWTPGKV